MPFCFMSFRPAMEGVALEADCPDDVEYLLLADPRGTDWGLFDYCTAEGSESWTPQHTASGVLAALIESGKRYPPALALARQETEEVFEGHQPSIEEFQRAYIDTVRHHLSHQHEARYVLAMAMRDEAGYLSKGEWYWILRTGSSAVSWVSDDFCVYDNPLADFDLTDTQLKYLS
jgi:hypothetical protein